MADPSNDYFAARDQQRQWDGGDSSMGGYGASGLVGTGRQLRRTRGGSFLHVPSGPGPQTGGGVAKTARYNTQGPAPLSTTDPSSQKTETIRYPKAEGVAPNFDRPSPGSGGMNFPTLDKIGNLAAQVGGAIGARKAKAADKAPKQPQSAAPSAAPTGQPLPPPTGPAQPGPQPWGPPKASENLTYTTGNTPFTLGDDPFVGADTDEWGRPIKNTGGNQGGQPWGPPTGPPKHGPIYTTESGGGPEQPRPATAPPTSRTQRRPAGEQAPAPAAPPSSEQFAAPPASRTQGRPSVFIDDFANQEEFPDTYSLGTPLSAEEEGAIRRQDVAARRPDSGGQVAPGRPESSGRTLPNRPGGRRIAANPNPWFSGQGTEFAGGQPSAPAPTPETSGMTRREQVAASRPQSTGRQVPGRPTGATPPTPDTSGFYQGDQGQLFDAGPVAQQAPQADAPQEPSGQIPGQRQLLFRPDSTGRQVPGRPAPSGRTVPGRPGSAPQPVTIDDYANQEQYPDTMSTLEAVAGTAPDGVRPESSGRTVPGRPESSGRTLPNRPGGRRGNTARPLAPEAFGPPAPSSPAPASPAPASPAPTPETSGMTRRQQVAASRPNSLGQTAASPFRPRSVMAQQAQEAQQAQVESAATSMEYPSAAPTNTGMSPNGRYPANWNDMSRDEQFRWLKDNGREGEGWNRWRS